MKKVRTRPQGWNLDIGTNADTTEESCLLSSSFGLAQDISYTSTTACPVVIRRSSFYSLLIYDSMVINLVAPIKAVASFNRCCYCWEAVCFLLCRRWLTERKVLNRRFCGFVALFPLIFQITNLQSRLQQHPLEMTHFFQDMLVTGVKMCLLVLEGFNEIWILITHKQSNITLLCCCREDVGYL